MSVASALILAEPAAWLEYNTLPSVPLTSATPADINAYRVAVVAPEKIHNPAVPRILRWKAEGRLPNTELVMGTYKCIHDWSTQTDSLAARWVVHTTSEINRTGSRRMVFVPVPSRLPHQPDPVDGTYVFIGGRKNRDFEMAVRACEKAALPGLCVTDKYTVRDSQFVRGSGVVPPGVYLRQLAEARVVLVPVKPAQRSQGHCDCAKGHQAGKPLVVVRAAACDDYVNQGVDGWLCDYSADSMAYYLRKAWDTGPSMRDACLAAGARCSLQAFAASITKLAEEVSRDVG